MKITRKAFHRLHNFFTSTEYLKANSPNYTEHNNQLELTYDERRVAPGVRSVDVHVVISNKHARIVTRDT